MDANEAAPAVASPDRRRFTFLAIVGIVFALAAIIGAYVDWLWWPVYWGIALTVVALVVMLAGAILAVITHGRIRRLALVILAIGGGLLVGQNLGPTRAPLLYSDGTLTITLDGPVHGEATGPATCSMVADGSESSISGDPNLQLTTADDPFVSIYFDRGDRWEAIYGGPRADGVRLVITVTPRAIPADGKPGTIGMGADETSSVTIDADATGGVLRFADLVPLTGVDYTGEAMDLSGTIEYQCDGLPAD